MTCGPKAGLGMDDSGWLRWLGKMRSSFHVLVTVFTQCLSEMAPRRQASLIETHMYPDARCPLGYLRGKLDSWLTWIPKPVLDSEISKTTAYSLSDFFA